MDIFDVFSMNGIENYPAAGEFFLENVILKVSQTHFPKDLYPKGGGGGGGINFSRGGGGQCPPRGGAVKYPAIGKLLLAHYARKNRQNFSNNQTCFA